MVKQIASVFKKGPLKEIRVTGYGDSLATSDRSKEFFLTLASSKARATHVVQVLKESGVDPGELYIEVVWRHPTGCKQRNTRRTVEESPHRNRRLSLDAHACCRNMISWFHGSKQKAYASLDMVRPIA